MTYCFRLRFRTNYPIEIEEQKVSLTRVALGDLTLASESGTIKNAKWLVLKASGYPTEDAAREDGKRVQDALLLAGIEGRFGADCGDDRSSISFDDQFMRGLLGIGDGTELRPSVHGLEVYPDYPVRHINGGAEGSASFQGDEFRRLLEARIKLSRRMSERQRICAMLLNDSLFPMSTEAQFITRVSAIEALCEQGEGNGSTRSLADQLIGRLGELEGPEDAKETIRRQLTNVQKKSIRNAYMAKFRDLLGEAQAREFDRLYQLRSAFVHEGRGRSTFTQPAIDTLQLAAELLMTEIQS